MNSMNKNCKKYVIMKDVKQNINLKRFKKSGDSKYNNGFYDGMNEAFSIFESCIKEFNIKK